MPSSISLARALFRDAARSSLRGGGNSCVVRRFECDAKSKSVLLRRQLPSSSCINSQYHPFSTAPQVDEATEKEQAPPTATVVKSKLKDGAPTSSISEDSSKPPQKISNVKISEVLKRKHTLRWVEPVISKDATVREAISVCIDRKLNGMMVVEYNKTASPKTGTMELKQKCVGLITSRDILRMMASSIKDGKTSDEVLNEKISTQMTPINQVIYGRPDETIGMCRAIMAKLGIKCLPILSDGRVEGILTGRDMADFYFDAKDRGGKSNYLRDVSERVGLTENTSMAEPPVFVRQHLALRHAPLYLNVGVVEYPHPFKTHDGIGSSRRSECIDCVCTSDMSSL